MFGFAEGMGASAASMLLFLAVASTVVLWWSWLTAIRVSRGHPPFDRLIGGRRYVGYEALSHMPEHARPHIRRHFIALAVFFIAPLLLWVMGS